MKDRRAGISKVRERLGVETTERTEMAATMKAFGLADEQATGNFAGDVQVWYPTPAGDPVIADINAKLDRLDPTRKPLKAEPDLVDHFLAEERERRVREAKARAEQAAWEKRMRINTVLHPVPVRVDARMRPVTS